MLENKDVCNPDHYWQLPMEGIVDHHSNFPLDEDTKVRLVISPIAYLNRYQSLVRTRTQACLTLLAEDLLIQR